MKYFCSLLLLILSLGAHAQWDPFVKNGVFISHNENGLVLQCEGVSLGTVLQTLAEHLKLNILLTEPLAQPVTMTLHGLSQQEILQQLLLAYNLRSVEKEGLTVILPSSNLGSHQAIKTFTLNYASAEEVAEKLKSRLQTGFDSRTNALIIYEAQDNLAWVQELIAQIDVPAKQVYIEALIMNANKKFSKELGLRYRLDEFSIATLPKDIPLQVTIDAAQENHQTNVIANPKLLTVNLQEAHIKQGKQIAYQEIAANGATSLTFLEAALELKVIPMITPEHDILLDLLVKQDVLGSIAINGQPTIDTKSIQAKVRVKDGETVVLGGIYSQVDNTQGREVPFLGRIPLIGLLFQDNRRLDDKDELLIFVTPRVVI